MKALPHPTALCGLTPEELQALPELSGEKPYRVEQILSWLWPAKVEKVDEMTNLPNAIQEKLEKKVCISPLKLVKAQGAEDETRKLLFQLHDKRLIESVLIPANPALYGQKSDRLTLCVSSQVGCAYACKFCASGLDGFVRNLTIAEIVGQVYLAGIINGRRVDNLVFMGMGEPLANLPNLLPAIEILTASWGAGIGARHLTISTSGVVPKILELARHPKQIRLAISLHGATDEVRDKIMPINKKWPVEKLFEALQDWNTYKKQRITLEYILIEGLNDNIYQARKLARKAKSIQAKVNLIPYNTVEGLTWKRPSENVCRKFQNTLKQLGVVATLRLEKGHEIEAACGQLRLHEERKISGDIKSS